MRKRLQLAFMLTASTAIATSFFLSIATQPVWAAEGDGPSNGITTTEEHGRKVYVNEDAPAQKHAAQAKDRVFHHTAWKGQARSLTG